MPGQRRGGSVGVVGGPAGGASRALLGIVRASSRLVLLLWSLGVLLVILPVGAEVVVVVVAVVVVVIAAALVPSAWEEAPPSAPEVERPPEAAVESPELSTVVGAPLILLLPVMRRRMRPGPRPRPGAVKRSTWTSLNRSRLIDEISRIKKNPI